MVILICLYGFIIGLIIGIAILILKLLGLCDTRHFPRHPLDYQ